MAGDELLTVGEVRERLKLKNVETVRRWLRQGKLRGTLISDSTGYRIRASEIERLLSGEPLPLTPEPRGPQGGEMTGNERGREG